MKRMFIESYYTQLGIAVAAAVFIIILAIFYKRQFAYEIYKFYSEKAFNWGKKHEHTVNLILRTAEIVFAVVVIILYAKLIADFPNLIKENYTFKEGKVIEIEYVSSKAKVRFNEDPRWYQLNTSKCTKGDVIKICSLPISGNSIVTELNGYTIVDTGEKSNE